MRVQVCNSNPIFYFFARIIDSTTLLRYQNQGSGYKPEPANDLVFHQRGRRVKAEHSIYVFVHRVHILLKGIAMLLTMIFVRGGTPCEAEKSCAYNGKDDDGRKFLW